MTLVNLRSYLDGSHVVPSEIEELEQWDLANKIYNATGVSDLVLVNYDLKEDDTPLGIDSDGKYGRWESESILAEVMRIKGKGLLVDPIPVFRKNNPEDFNTGLRLKGFKEDDFVYTTVVVPLDKKHQEVSFLVKSLGNVQGKEIYTSTFIKDDGLIISPAASNTRMNASCIKDPFRIRSSKNFANKSRGSAFDLCDFYLDNNSKIDFEIFTLPKGSVVSRYESSGKVKGELHVNAKYYTYDPEYNKMNHSFISDEKQKYFRTKKDIKVLKCDFKGDASELFMRHIALFYIFGYSYLDNISNRKINTKRFADDAKIALLNMHSDLSGILEQNINDDHTAYELQLFDESLLEEVKIDIVL